MSDGLLRRLRDLASRAGVDGPLRTAYNAIVYARTTRTISLRGIRRTFRTPTGTIREHVDTFAGEETVLLTVLSSLRSDDCFWDVGASFGLYSMFASGMITLPGHVHAFEPEERMRRLLADNAALNGNVPITVHACALGDRNGEALLYRSASPNVGTSALSQRRDYRLKNRGVNVPVRRGDQVITDGTAKQPTVLKIDVEGGEGRVLAGLGEVLQRRSLRLLVCEVHPHLLGSFGDSAQALEALIADAGFDITARIPRGTEYHLLCRHER